MSRAPSGSETYERSTWRKSKPKSLGYFHLSFSAMHIVSSNKGSPLKIAAFGTKKLISAVFEKARIG